MTAAERSTTRRTLRSSLRSVALLLAASSAAAGCWANNAADRVDERLEEVIVQAARVPDEQITAQVQEALKADPWIFAEHVSITTRHGVVTVEGIVQDTGERFRILRLCRKIPGAKRIVDALEMNGDVDPDGG